MNIENLQSLFEFPISVEGNLISKKDIVSENASNQNQTKDIFSDKWKDVEKYEDVDSLFKFQFEWFLKLYGFESEELLAAYLATKNTIIDTGCGLGYKAAWFAKLAPHATVIGIDISDAAFIAAKNFKQYSNLFFLKEDIAKTGLKNNVIDFKARKPTFNI